MVNLWLTVVLLVLICVQFYVCNVKVYTSIYETQTVVIAVFFSLLSLGFLYVGYNGGFSSSRLNVLVWTCILLYQLRGVLFLVRPITGYKFTGLLGKILYPWFFYVIPEVIPSTVLVLFMRPLRKLQREGQQEFYDALEE